MAVRRRYNRAADQAATDGCEAAARAAAMGQLEPLVFVVTPRGRLARPLDWRLARARAFTRPRL
eukprot:1636347-Lingulodinium_polyedra.AAC.1